MSQAHYVAAAGSALGGSSASVALTLAGSAVGLAIGYFAYLGYRRNESVPMLFVAAGFLLAFGAPALLYGGYVAVDALVAVAPELDGRLATAVSLASETVRLIGLLCILYGLWTPVREDASGRASSGLDGDEPSDVRED